MEVLVVDVGGSHIKLMATGAQESRSFESHDQLTPDQLVHDVIRHSEDWQYDAVSLGYPGAVNADGPAAEPGNLGQGWVGFNFTRAFARPVRIINDAVMQALGGYDGGRMLFLGLGTGVGSALITEHVIVPLELGCLPYKEGGTVAERLGKQGLADHGEEAWRQALESVTGTLREAFAADYLLLGGGNAARVDPLPDGTRRGHNDDAFVGGFRLWEEMVEPHDHRPETVWRVVR